MWLLFIALSVVAGFLSHWSVIAIVVVGLSVWANGVIANYSRAEYLEVPDWAAALSALTVATSLVLILVAVI